ncbi:MAG TPA: STAS domain-containing protein [Chloroflexota bacterium]|nr:STAS domain-containing protein [Chloroflexota bacterium]
MLANPLDATVRYLPGIAIINLRGQINAFGEDVLNAAYAELAKQNPSTILLNFSQVDYINSTGIALIVSLLAQSRKSGSRMLACGLSEHYTELFRITRLIDFIGVFPDEASALASVTPASAT